MAFRFTGLDPAPFQHLFGASVAVLSAEGVRRMAVGAEDRFPDRVEVRDAAPGETVLLLNYIHQPAATPYRASHAIFIREGATARFDAVDEVPPAVQRRPISLRGFDVNGDLVAADLVLDGSKVEPNIARLFAQPAVAYLHAHFAAHGCFAARIERA